MKYKLPPLPEPTALGMDFDKGWDGIRAYGYTEDDMQAYAIAAIEAQGVPDHSDPSCVSYDLAAIVMSDCGHSTNNQRLLDRIAARIDKHVEALIASTPPAPQAEKRLTGFVLPTHFDVLTGAGIPDPTMFGNKTQAKPQTLSDERDARIAELERELAEARQSLRFTGMV